jgi:predicted  nucleic acid-binding Zn-ribbon protein
MSESEQSELERLRQELERHRVRELETLREALAAARDEAAHYRAEAQRNAEVGRQIDREYRQQIEQLRAKLETFTNPSFARPQHAGRN